MIGANTVREEFKMEPAEFLRHIDKYMTTIASKDNFREILRKFDKLKNMKLIFGMVVLLLQQKLIIST